ncbi:MAG: ACR3 family arsenite efflux transporter [Candidatus Heimdallarchaeota archaeon]
MTAVVGKLSRLDRFLPLWIFLAMGIGVLLGFLPGIVELFNLVQFGTVSLPIALGLLWMMYPVLAKVKYEELGKVATAWKMFGVSVFLNWAIGPVLMFVLALTFLADFTAYREGLIIVGLARCIAMVLIWNLLAGGDNEYCAVLVALNSIFQVFFYSIYAYFFLTVASGWLAGTSTVVSITMKDIAISVFIFLGIPILAGIATRFGLIHRKGKAWYEEEFTEKLGPTALIGLLFTIVVMFSMQGANIVDLGWELARIAIPLTGYFFIMFVASFLISWALHFLYPETVTLSFTAASNNFELAIAVAVGTFGIDSGQALATVVGPLIEVPVLISLVYVSLWVRKYFFTKEGTAKKFGTPS